jgi:hypothetical protein
MANYNRCRGPNCRNLIEEPFAHCCLDCVADEKRAREARKRPAPKSRPTLSMTQAHQMAAEATSSTYAETVARNDAMRDARNQA